MERDAPDEALRHYTYRWIPKRAGGGRLLEMPKPMLRFFQRRILREILDPIPPHPAAHGFRRGRSVATFATPHAGQRTVIRLDLESFFTSVTASRVVGIFRTAGYPDPVARSLAGMATNTVPVTVRRAAPRAPAAAIDGHRRLVSALGHPHLPQGAPTSPALANLVAFGLDRRLAGLAAAYDTTYTRYADDLAFSGGHRLGRHADALIARVRAIVANEGFATNDAKTRVRDAGQRQLVAGLVVNDHPQVARREYDRLRAILHDAARNGPGAANRADHPDFRSHLLGRIGWVATGNPARASKLQRQFDSISW
jgi:RNA-directed DNA polymerase